MPKTAFTLGAIFALTVLSAAPCAWAHDGERILIPMRSHLSPVQKLNREGVEAIRKHDYNRAESLFYKAYLYDPADPFTLNNLGYVSELEGRLDRAQRFYQLATEQSSDANIDESSLKQLKGQPMKAALVELKDTTMRVNRLNLDAMRALEQDQDFEALEILKQALNADPRNPFTLNNLGVAYESVADLDSAMRCYQEAAATGSNEPAMVTLDRSWRGHSVSDMARESASRLQRKMRSIDPAEAKAVMYTLRGVHAENANNWTEARQDFLHAYALDPNSAFSLNNRGYVAEREGDLETAQFFYQRAQRATGSTAKVGIATRLYANGQPLNAVASQSNNSVDDALEVYSRQRKQPSARVELTPRGGTPEPNPNPTPNTPQSPQ
ncbi:MAG TPA: tetratricopeptide repeat protein [Terracidiphilus sp.]|nr:tetratricopeptide repeat protein [Terracidiphilus sp.]